MSHARSDVDEYVSSAQSRNSLPETLQFEVGNLQETTKSSQETIAGLEEANAMLREQLDDLEKYTRRTNISGYLESLSQQTAGLKYRSQVIVLPIQKVSQTLVLRLNRIF